MTPDADLPVLLDRLAVEDARPPGSLWREPWFLLGAFITLACVAPSVLFEAGSGARLLLALAAIPASFAAWTATRWLRRQRRHRRLQTDGRRHAASGLRSVTVNWASRSRVYRWTVVAQWRDAAGVARAAWSADYDYDPQPLLAGRSATVLADPQDPTTAILLADGLPPRRRRALTHAARAVAPENPMLREYRIAGIAAFVLLLAVLAFAWATLRPGHAASRAADAEQQQ